MRFIPRSGGAGTRPAPRLTLALEQALVGEPEELDRIDAVERGGRPREGRAHGLHAVGHDRAVDRAEMPDGVDQVRASFAWALAPADGTDPVELFRCADERLLARKRATRARRAAHLL